MSLPPESLEELTAGYVLGDLSSEEAEEFGRLLIEDPSLAIEVNRLQEVLGLIPYALPEVEPSPRLRSAILEAAPAAGERNQTPKRSLLQSRIVGGVAALLALALGLENYRSRQDLTTTQARVAEQKQLIAVLRQDLTTRQVQVAEQKELIAMLRQPSIHLVSLEGADLAPAASGSFVMNPSKPGAFLALQNLPSLPTGQVYQLYSVVNDKKIAWGQFNTSPNGTVLVKLPVPPKAEVTTLVVTLEQSPTSTRSVGPTVMTTETTTEL